MVRRKKAGLAIEKFSPIIEMKDIKEVVSLRGSFFLFYFYIGRIFYILKLEEKFFRVVLIKGLKIGGYHERDYCLFR